MFPPKIQKVWTTQAYGTIDPRLGYFVEKSRNLFFLNLTPPETTKPTPSLVHMSGFSFLTFAVSSQERSQNLNPGVPDRDKMFEIRTLETIGRIVHGRHIDLISFREDCHQDTMAVANVLRSL
jgi:hypothetical protein